jgi:hypothetical protein
MTPYDDSLTHYSPRRSPRHGYYKPGTAPRLLVPHLVEPLANGFLRYSARDHWRVIYRDVASWRAYCRNERLPNVTVRDTDRRARVTLHLPDGFRLSEPGVVEMRRLFDSARVKRAPRGWATEAGGWCWCDAADADLLARHVLDLYREHVEPREPPGGAGAA